MVDPVAGAATRETFAAKQRLHLGGEFGHLAKADLVRLIGGQAGAGVEAKALMVETLAVRKSTGGRAGAGATAKLVEDGDLPVQSRGQAAVDDGRSLSSPIPGYAFLAGPADQRLDQPGLLALLAAKRPSLGQSLVDDVGRRDDPEAGIRAGLVDLEIDVSREILEPRDIGRSIFAVLDLVLAVEEVGNFLIGTGKLGEHVGNRIAIAADPAVRNGGFLGHPVAEPQDRVQPGAVTSGELIPVDRAQLRQMIEQRPIGPHLARRRGIAEPALEIGPFAGIEAQARGHFR